MPSFAYDLNNKEKYTPRIGFGDVAGSFASTFLYAAGSEAIEQAALGHTKRAFALSQEGMSAAEKNYFSNVRNTTGKTFSNMASDHIKKGYEEGKWYRRSYSKLESTLKGRTNYNAGIGKVVSNRETKIAEGIQNRVLKRQGIYEKRIGKYNTKIGKIEGKLSNIDDIIKNKRGKPSFFRKAIDLRKQSLESVKSSFGYNKGILEKAIERTTSGKSALNQETLNKINDIAKKRRKWTKAFHPSEWKRPTKLLTARIKGIDAKVAAAGTDVKFAGAMSKKVKKGILTDSFLKGLTTEGRIEQIYKLWYGKSGIHDSNISMFGSTKGAKNLYTQFENTMTRFLADKGWGLSNTTLTGKKGLYSLQGILKDKMTSKNIFKKSFDKASEWSGKMATAVTDKTGLKWGYYRLMNTEAARLGRYGLAAAEGSVKSLGGALTKAAAGIADDVGFRTYATMWKVHGVRKAAKGVGLKLGEGFAETLKDKGFKKIYKEFSESFSNTFTKAGVSNALRLTGKDMFSIIALQTTNTVGKFLGAMQTGSMIALGVQLADMGFKWAAESGRQKRLEKEEAELNRSYGSLLTYFHVDSEAAQAVRQDALMNIMALKEAGNEAKMKRTNPYDFYRLVAG